MAGTWQVDNCCGCEVVDCGKSMSVFARSWRGKWAPVPTWYAGTWSASSDGTTITDDQTNATAIIHDWWAGFNSDFGYIDAGDDRHTSRYNKRTATLSGTFWGDQGDGLGVTQFTLWAELVIEYDADAGFLKSISDIRKKDGTTYYSRAWSVSDSGTESETITGDNTLYGLGSFFIAWDAFVVGDVEMVVSTAADISVSMSYEVMSNPSLISTFTATLALTEIRTAATALTAATTLLGSGPTLIGETVEDCLVGATIQDETTAWGDAYLVEYEWFPKRIVVELIGRLPSFGSPSDGAARREFAFETEHFRDVMVAERSRIMAGVPPDCSGEDGVLSAEQAAPVPNSNNLKTGSDNGVDEYYTGTTSFDDRGYANGELVILTPADVAYTYGSAILDDGT